MSFFDVIVSRCPNQPCSGLQYRTGTGASLLGCRVAFCHHGPVSAQGKTGNRPPTCPQVIHLTFKSLREAPARSSTAMVQRHEAKEDESCLLPSISKIPYLRGSTSDLRLVQPPGTMNEMTRPRDPSPKDEARLCTRTRVQELALHCFPTHVLQARHHS